MKKSLTTIIVFILCAIWCTAGTCQRTKYLTIKSRYDVKDTLDIRGVAVDSSLLIVKVSADDLGSIDPASWALVRIKELKKDIQSDSTGIIKLKVKKGTYHLFISSPADGTMKAKVQAKSQYKIEVHAIIGFCGVIN